MPPLEALDADERARRPMAADSTGIEEGRTATRPRPAACCSRIAPCTARKAMVVAKERLWLQTPPQGKQWQSVRGLGEKSGKRKSPIQQPRRVRLYFFGLDKPTATSTPNQPSVPNEGTSGWITAQSRPPRLRRQVGRTATTPTTRRTRSTFEPTSRWSLNRSSCGCQKRHPMPWPSFLWPSFLWPSCSSPWMSSTSVSHSATGWRGRPSPKEWRTPRL